MGERLARLLCGSQWNDVVVFVACIFHGRIGQKCFVIMQKAAESALKKL